MPYKCPIKQKQAQHKSYLKHKKKVITKSMAYKHNNQKWFKEEKLKDVMKGCVDCGCTGNMSTLTEFDYHHIYPQTKILAVSDMLGTFGRPKVIAEMKKCELLCKPCHRKYH
tara:strand:+ start:147 stop:482 length:336 start_codon:yes stop_codon:yes gene_type:complete